MKQSGKNHQVPASTSPAARPRSAVRGPSEEDRLVLQSFAMNESNWVIGSAGMYADVKRLQPTGHEEQVNLNKEAQ